MNTCIKCHWYDTAEGIPADKAGYCMVEPPKVILMPRLKATGRVIKPGQPEMLEVLEPASVRPVVQAQHRCAKWMKPPLSAATKA